MSSEEAEITAEEIAKQLLLGAIERGMADEIYNTWAFCKQSCDYVYGIVRDVAYNESLHLSEDVKNFARNLLDDWSK